MSDGAGNTIAEGGIAAGTGALQGTQMNCGGRMAAYLRSLEPFADEELNRLRDEAEAAGVPIIRPETESFLRTMLKIIRPARILEIGTAVGYSSIAMAKACDARIDTIENYEKRIPAARANIRAAGLEERITLIKGDAGEVLRELAQGAEDATDCEPAPSVGAGGARHSRARRGSKQGTVTPEKFDFVFLDAAKGQYLTWLPDILRLMKPGAVLVADNVLQDGTVMESRFLIPRRERTTHARMREFLYEIKHHPELETSVLPVGDGVSLSYLYKK